MPPKIIDSTTHGFKGLLILTPKIIKGYCPALISLWAAMDNEPSTVTSEVHIATLDSNVDVPCVEDWNTYLLTRDLNVITMVTVLLIVLSTFTVFANCIVIAAISRAYIKGIPSTSSIALPSLAARNTDFSGHIKPLNANLTEQKQFTRTANTDTTYHPSTDITVTALGYTKSMPNVSTEVDSQPRLPTSPVEMEISTVDPPIKKRARSLKTIATPAPIHNINDSFAFNDTTATISKGFTDSVDNIAFTAKSTFSPMSDTCSESSRSSTPEARSSINHTVDSNTVATLKSTTSKAIPITAPLKGCSSRVSISTITTTNSSEENNTHLRGRMFLPMGAARLPSRNRSKTRLNAERSSIPILLIFSMAVSDALMGALVMPLSVVEIMNNGKWPLGSVICQFRMYLDMALSTSSVYHVAYLALDRYLCVCRPYFHRTLSLRAGILAVAVCWSVALLIPVSLQIPGSSTTGVVQIPAVHCRLSNELDNIPNSVENSSLLAPSGRRSSVHVCAQTLSKAANSTCMSVSFLIPLCIIFILYTLTLIEIKSISKKRIALQATKRLDTLTKNHKDRNNVSEGTTAQLKHDVPSDKENNRKLSSTGCWNTINTLKRCGRNLFQCRKHRKGLGILSDVFPSRFFVFSPMCFLRSHNLSDMSLSRFSASCYTCFH